MEVLFSLFFLASISLWSKENEIKLPQPQYEGKVSVEEALKKRRSIRSYKKQSLTIKDISQLLWAGYGVTDINNRKTTPSAGATYPIEIYLVCGEVEGIANGVYRYVPSSHSIIKIKDKDVRNELFNVSLKQSWVKEGSAVIIITADYSKTTKIYGERGNRYVLMEAGIVAQNIHLQAVSLNAGTVIVGAFEDEKVSKIVGLSEKHLPLIIMPVGRI